jgi:aspartyl-tRNA synthetase
MGKLAFFGTSEIVSALLQAILVPAELSERGKAIMSDIRSEYCLRLTGIVQKRGEKQVNPNLATGFCRASCERYRAFECVEDAAV